jgi:transglutaminase-like putative cysteine protease
MKGEPLTTLSRIPTQLLLAAYLAGSALHMDMLPVWCTATAAAAVLWRWLHMRGKLPLPHPAVRILLAMMLLAAVLATFRTIGGVTAGGALLIAMGAAKLLETRTARDAVVVATVALILVLAAGLDRQALARLPFYLGTAWLALACIAAVGSVTARQSAPRAFASSGWAMLLALPLALLCFVVVPRLPGGLWGSPSGNQALTGLGEEMSPGSISELVESDAVAFRVRFEDSPPPPAERYWRGPVLHEFDGYTWRRARFSAAVPQPSEPASAALRYQVMLEPHGRNHLFGLDHVAGIEGQRYTQWFDGQLLTPRPVNAPLIYEAVSNLRLRYQGSLSRNGRLLDTQLPPDRNPRSHALVQQLYAEAGNDAAFADRLMRYFREGGFRYSLTPPLLDYNSVDDLLFRTKLGFCGHFASAYVAMMRAAGVPARVVTGYLGGSWNAVGGYFVVRQSAAHAWAEIWLDGRGWVRVDPTAAVAPARLEGELADLLPDSQSFSRALLGNADWMVRLRDRWDAANGWWFEQVVNFNRARQIDLLAKLGLDRIDYGGMALLLAAGAGAWGAVLLLLLGRRGPQTQRDALGRMWARYAALLSRRGVAVAAHDGPDAVRRHAQREFPEAAAEIDRFTRDYAQLRYGRGAAPDDAALRGLNARLRAIARATAAHRRQRTAPAAPE